MKTQTAIEWLEDCFNRYGEVLKTDFKKAKQMERDHTTTQIEALRDRLENETTTYDFQGVGLVKIISIDVIRQTINEFLKEIND
jgi:hypothetical protein